VTRHVDPDRLAAAVDKVLAGESDPWTDLCVAAVRLGCAFAEFENACSRYGASKTRPSPEEEINRASVRP